MTLAGSSDEKDNRHPVRCIWPVAAALGEGATWSERGACLWFVDITGKRLFRFEPATGARSVWSSPERIGFVAEREDGRLVAGLADGLALFCPETGTFSRTMKVELDRPGNRLNDGAVGPDGALWFGTMHDPQSEPFGAWYRWAGGQYIARFDDGYVITNGPAFSGDGSAIYYCDTLGRRILRRTLGSQGNVGPLEVFIALNEQVGFPDGIAIDDRGWLWVAIYGGGQVRCYDRGGIQKDVVELPCSNPTKPAFGGPERRTLFVTTARQGLSAEELRRQPSAGGLFAIEMSVAGLAARVLGRGIEVCDVP